MAEPQPSTATEGMDDPAPAPASAEDRKAAAAMNALESSRAVDEENQKPTNQADADKINQAISRLELVDKAGKVSTEDPNEERRKKREDELKEKERRAKIKVDQAHVNFMVEELDMTKTKAKEFLQAHEGDFKVALRAYVRTWA